MHPIERIRALARASWLDPKSIAIEATEAIGDAYVWMDEPAAVAVARRLLAWHPYCGPLWWACGEVLNAVDPAQASRDVVRCLLDDTTGLALDVALPEGARPLVVGRCRAMEEIGDCRARSVQDATHLLLGAAVLGPGGLVSDAPADALVAAAGDAGVPVWAVAERGAGVDAGLWARLEALVRAAFVRPAASAVTDVWWDDQDHDHAEPRLVELGSLDWVCGPDGLEVPAEAVADAPTTPRDLLDAAGAPAF
ncbi:MAG: hypothetical protein K1X95_02990 [Acidimicrobiia bacterium]|nr:hypothetical protein [Acidimicrobiia bacterium]